MNNEKLDICELLKVLHEEDEWEDVVPEEIEIFQCKPVVLRSICRTPSPCFQVQITAWRRIAKLLVCTGKSRSEIYDLDLKPDRVVKLLREVKARIAASENTTIAANNMVELRYKGKQTKLEQQINEAKKLSSRYAESGQMVVLAISRKRSLHSKNHSRELLQH